MKKQIILFIALIGVFSACTKDPVQIYNYEDLNTEHLQNLGDHLDVIAIVNNSIYYYDDLIQAKLISDQNDAVCDLICFHPQKDKFLFLRNGNPIVMSMDGQIINEYVQYSYVEDLKWVNGGKSICIKADGQIYFEGEDIYLPDLSLQISGLSEVHSLDYTANGSLAFTYHKKSYQGWNTIHYEGVKVIYSDGTVFHNEEVVDSYGDFIYSDIRFCHNTEDLIITKSTEYDSFIDNYTLGKGDETIKLQQSNSKDLIILEEGNLIVDFLSSYKERIQITLVDKDLVYTLPNPNSYYGSEIYSFDAKP